MEFCIREFNPVDEEYRACLAVQHASFPDQPPVTLAEARSGDRENAKGKFKAKFVITLDQTIIGSGKVTEPSGISIKGKMRFRYDLHPDHDALVVDGQPVYAHIEQYVLDLIADREIDGLLTRAREDKRAMVDWLEAHGYVCKMRMPLSTLDIASFDFAPWQGYIERVEATGITFYTMDYLKEHDPDWHPKLFRTWVEIFLDVPTPFPAPPRTLEQFNKMLHDPAATPELWLIAVDNTQAGDTQFGAYAGVTLVNRVPSTPTVLDIALTGVCRHWRRRGIATAIKLKSIAMARKRKATQFKTGNEEANPMLVINMQLGFEPAPAWLDYAKVLPSAL